MKTCRPVLRSNYRRAACINRTQFNNIYSCIKLRYDHGMFVLESAEVQLSWLKNLGRGPRLPAWVMSATLCRRSIELNCF
jgi:hypothetical protein